MRILITGGEGQLARALAAAGRAGGPIGQVISLGRSDLDVTDAARVRRAIADAAPAVVLHCAAMTDTARCEREPDAADAVNAHGTENVARACAAAGARLVAISTDEVFDGEKGTPYAEDDEPAALNAYGRSKLRGERLARAAHADTLVVRTSWVYGGGASDFAAKVLTAAHAGRPLRFVTDETASPTSAADLAEALRALIERAAPPGVYHLTNEGEASRYAWACEILRLAGMGDVPVAPVTTDQLRATGYDGPRKPPYSALANTRARALGITLRPWRDALRAWMTAGMEATPVRRGMQQ
ncbi:MAG: dTDP-4-dehydrorhamnose reductase [Chloroflexota bacterium]|nr:dTDP-4-dehydrorhamnose reductase [Chloroflexota bacterium]